MTSRERMLAAINMGAIDRLPFWPKLDNAYPRIQKQPFKSMAISELHRWIGSDQHEFLPECTREVRKNSFSTIEVKGSVKTITYNTKYGQTRAQFQFDEESQAWHPVEMAIKDLDDIGIMIERYSDCQIEIDRDGLEKGKYLLRNLGDEGITAQSIGESPLMYFLEWLAGIENAHFLLMDYRKEVEELFDAMYQMLLRKTEVVCEASPADLLYFIENTSTTLISPMQFRQYCLNHLQDYGKLIASWDKNMGLHMCGHLKALLKDIESIPAVVVEAFTSPTVGNTSLLDGRSSLVSKCILGGTNATLWTMEAEDIINKLEKDLDALPHHRGIVITSGGVMTPLCPPETIKNVCDWIKSYKVAI